MAVSLVFKTVQAQIDVLLLDASLSESHKAKVTTTSHPVEQGAKITDHKYREPDTLVIEGLISNDPMPDPAVAGVPDTFTFQGVQNNINSGGQGTTLHYSARSAFNNERAGFAYQVLLGLLNSPNLIAVVTSIRSYENFVMTDLEVPRDSKSGQALKFTATFTEIRVVNNQTVQVQAKVKKAQPGVNLNKKTPPEAAAAQKKRSFLKATSDSSFGKDPIGTVSKVFGLGG